MKPGGKCSKATKAKMRLHHVGMLGKKHSEKTKAKMRGKRKGRIITPEWHQNIVLAHRTEAYREKMRELRTGRKDSEETRRKISEGLLRSWAAKRSATVCVYLTASKHLRLYQCMNNPGNCRKKSSIICPKLEIELKRGEQIDRIRLEKRIGDMAPEYFRYFYLSAAPHDRNETLEIYAKLHNIPIQMPGEREKLVLMLHGDLTTKTAQEKNLTGKIRMG